MTAKKSKLCDSVQEKLSGYIDGELTQQDTQFVRVHLSQCNCCQETLNDVLANRGHLKSTLLNEPGLIRQDHQATTPIGEHAELSDIPSKVMQWVGWPLLILGTLMIALFAGWQFVTDNSVPAWARAASFAVLSGTILLLVAVLRQRLISRKTDKYKGINL